MGRPAWSLAGSQGGDVVSTLFWLVVLGVSSYGLMYAVASIITQYAEDWRTSGRSSYDPGALDGSHERID